MRRVHGRGRGFTLVEVLVVFAVISVLVAILLPALGMSREVARSAVCQTRLSQIVNACETYAGKNKQLLPPTATGSGSSQWDHKQNNGRTFADLLVDGNFSKREGFDCPSHDGLGRVLTGGNPSNVLSYGMNRTLDFNIIKVKLNATDLPDAAAMRGLPPSFVGDPGAEFPSGASKHTSYSKWKPWPSHLIETPSVGLFLSDNGASENADANPFARFGDNPLTRTPGRHFGGKNLNIVRFDGSSASLTDAAFNNANYEFGPGSVPTGGKGPEPDRMWRPW